MDLMIVMIVLLGCLGFAVGFLLAVWRKKRSSVLSNRPEQLTEAELHRLDQLKSQLENGLITDEEYRAEREKLLRT